MSDPKEAAPFDYPTYTGPNNVTISRAQHEALMAAAKALEPFAEAADAAERALCKHNTDEILIRLGWLRKAREKRAALRAAGILEGE